MRESKQIPRYDKHQRRTFKIPKELSLDDTIVPHQLSLNQFLLDFRDWMSYSDFSIPYQIKVEKLDDRYDWFRPDAIINIDTPEEPIHLYIEQDMGTEDKKSLMKKWDRYQKYIAAMKGEIGFGRMVMLFIINYDTSVTAPHGLNFNDFDHCIEYRKKELFRSIPYLFPDMLDNFFEAYMGTEKDTLETIFNRILYESMYGKRYYQQDFLQKHPQYNSYKFTNGERFFEDFGRVNFDSYIRLLHNGKLVPGTACVCDNGEYLPLSVFAKTRYMDRANAYFAGNHLGAPRVKYMICNCNEKEKYEEYCDEMGMSKRDVFFA